MIEEAILQLGKKYKNVVVLNNDNSRRSQVSQFAKFLHDRYFNFGLAESNTASCAVGFTVRGKIPFITGFSSFLTGGAFEQIRSDICYPNLNVKIVGTSSGLSASQDDVGCQALQDIALMRSLPNMKVICPADEQEAKSALEAMMVDYGPTYLRLYDSEEKVNEGNFEFGKLRVLFGHEFVGKAGPVRADICLFACGSMVSRSLEVARRLVEDGKRVIVANCASVKPLDVEGVLKLASSVLDGGICVTVEDHSVVGGLGSAVCETLVGNGVMRRVLRLGVEDKFVDSASSEDLYVKCGLDVEGLCSSISENL